ncbi:MAG: GGDEF domain-containing protein, partial [Burkholderiales bacterium PBB4]
MSLSDQVLETLDSQIAVIDSSGVILLVNSAWRAFWEEQGVAAGKLGVGKNYLRICRRIQERGNHDAMAVCAGLERVMSGEVQEFR